MPIDKDDLIPAGEIIKVDEGDLEPSTKVEVPKSWVQGEEPSLYDKFVKLFDDPEKESAKSVNALVNARTFNISPTQAYANADKLNKVVAGANEPYKGNRGYESFAAGYEASVPGIIYRQKLPGNFEPLGTYEELMYSVGNMLPSIPIWQAGALMGGPNPVTAFGGSVALEMGLRQVYTDMLRDGKGTTFSDFWQKLSGAVRETAKGEVMGSLAGKAGSMVKTGKPALKMAAEMGTLTTVGSLLEGRIPEEKDFIHAAMMVGVLHGMNRSAGAVKGKLFDLYKNRNLHPNDVANEINERMKDAELRPITDALKVVDLVPDGDGWRYEPKKEFFRSPVIKTVEQLMKEINTFREESLDGNTSGRKEHDSAIAEIFREDPQKAVTEWNESQKVEAVGKILTDLEMENLEFDRWHRKATGQKYLDTPERQERKKNVIESEKKRLGLAPESSQKTPSPVSSTGTSEAPGQITAKTTTASVPKPTVSDASTSDISTKEGLGQAERTAGDIVSDLNTVLQNKVGLTIQDVSLAEKQTRARERLKKDIRGFADKAASLDMDLPEYLKAVGFDETMIKKIRAINRAEKKKVNPAELYQLETDAMMNDMPLPEYLRSLGYTDKAIEKAMRPKSERTIPDIQPAIAPEGEKIIKQRSLGTKDNPLYAPPVLESELTGLKAIENYAEGSWENPIYMFRTLGNWAKETFYMPMKAAEDTAKRQFISIKSDVDSIFQNIDPEKIGIYSISKQDKGEFLLKHRGIKEVPKLNAAEMKVYERVREHMKVLYEQIQEARIASGKDPFPEVEDYFTFMHEVSFLEKLGISPLLVDSKYARNTIDNNIAEMIHMKATKFGYAKERTNALYDVDTNAHRIFLKYADTATQHIHKSPVIAKGRELLLSIPDGTPEGFQLKNKAPDVHTALTNWLDTQAGQKRSGLERVLNKQANRLADAGMKALNRNLAFAILSGSIRAALIQPTALLNTASRIGVGYTKHGIYSLFDEAMVKMAFDKSKVLLTREYDSTITEAIKGIDGSLINAKQWTAEKGLWALKTLDMKAAIATWLGAYEKAIALDKKSPEKAARYADEIVTMTQGSAMPSDLAPIQRTTLGKTLTTFQTFTINNWNFLVREVAGYKNKNVSSKEAFERVTTYIVGSILINILFEDILETNSPLPSPIRAGYKALERGDGLLGASSEMAIEMGQLLPGFGGLRYGSSPLGASIDFTRDVFRYGPTISTLSKGAGVPMSSQAKRWYEGETIKEKAFGKKRE